MTEGGGFCERHGPFDPPHTTCPYCAWESDERNAFGPPENTAPSSSVAGPEQAGVHDPADITAEPDATNPQGHEARGDVPEDAAPDEDVADDAADDAQVDDEFVLSTYEPEPHSPADAKRASSNVTEVAPRGEMLPEHWEEEDDTERAPLAWLVVKLPVRRRGAVLPIRPNQSIGREGDIQWDDPRLSRQHAKFTLESPHAADPDVYALPVFHIWPFGPTNPVFVNGTPIRGATPLHENDEITLGNTLFVFKVLLD
jgi:hypothetical protein